MIPEEVRTWLEAIAVDGFAVLVAADYFQEREGQHPQYARLAEALRSIDLTQSQVMIALRARFAVNSFFFPPVDPTHAFRISAEQFHEMMRRSAEAIMKWAEQTVPGTLYGYRVRTTDAAGKWVPIKKRTAISIRSTSQLRRVVLTKDIH